MLQPTSTVFLLCDIQTRFSARFSLFSRLHTDRLFKEEAIYGYDRVISTANKLISLAKASNPVHPQSLSYSDVLGLASQNSGHRYNAECQR